MNVFLIYILKSSLLLAVFVSLFMAFMSRETFHKINRFFRTTLRIFRTYA